MIILVAGASGFIGRGLAPALRAAGHVVRELGRGGRHSANGFSWNPSQRKLAPSALDGVDVVINLAGANVGRRWTKRRRAEIFQSRVDATATLVEAIAARARKPRLLLNASAVGYYGDRGDEELTEESAIGQGFLPEVCLAWETHAARAARVGVRTVCLRFGIVLGPDGGALSRMLPWFRLGLGGRLGGGTQWMSWIAREDVVGAVQHLIAVEACSGPVNMVAPGTVTNAEFTSVLAARLRRPAFLPAPRWALHLAFGRMADEALLASTRVVPAQLEQTGYTFRHPTLSSALGHALGQGGAAG